MWDNKVCDKKESISKASGTQQMICNVANTAVDNGKPVHHALQKSMGELNGERMMSCQETAHLMQRSLPVCSLRIHS
jgi:hypothetical protein